ncbi:uncharacterized protein LOC110691094 isoform X2 [Chenopodium quinoa]|uniref:uncharacterized protein LOC110691094 isoform X2 n=1 Tax=Chenopodium quinoa TaxID=63459 RepID=UPI000B79416D|nr:uncharacterized protein LOC110691094 isoform X2 [Chenopodium quinoa]
MAASPSASAAVASVSLLYARNNCVSSPVFSLRLGGGGSLPSSSSSSLSSSSSSSSSSSHCSSNSSWVNDSWQNQRFESHAMSTTAGNKPSSIVNGERGPDHLLVLVHGIMASPSDWTYFEAELKKRLGRNFLIYASSSNTFTKTFGGIDGAGKRLAEEVRQIVHRTESLKKISFLAHSLGGLFARYAVAVLYTPNNLGDGDLNDASIAGLSTKHGLIAGLEPINFITLASPHLGVRGRNQLPFLLGLHFLEKLAPSFASVFVGRTGSQLFLTDGKPNRPPLLLKMATDCEDGKFISALGAFKCRILYANVSFDHMVGWRTSSVRREDELPKPPQRSLDGYKHVVDVEYCPPVSSEGPQFAPEVAKAKEAAQTEPSTQNTVEYHELVEEEMIRGLQRVGWKKVDVSFHSAVWPFFAHNNIHVKNEWFHNAGTGVVKHVADSLKQQESSYLTANL